MAGPWEKYGNATQSAPWQNYGGAEAPAEAPAAEPSWLESLQSNPVYEGVRRAASGPIGLVTEAAGKGLQNLNDIAEHAAYTAGGKVTDATGSPGLGYVTNFGIQAVPAILGGGIPKMGGKMLESGARRVMQSALKPPIKAMQTGKAPRAIDTLLKKRLNVSEGGVEKLNGMIDDLNDKIKDAIAKSNATVDKTQVADYAQAAIEKFKWQVNSADDLAAIEKAADEFINNPIFMGQNKIPVQIAQKVKQGTYANLKDVAYGERKTAAVEAQKQLARGLKEGVEQGVPMVGPWNAEESALINARNLANRRVAVEGNKNPVGLGLATPNKERLAAWILDRSGAAKSWLAHLLYAGRGGSTIPRRAAQAIGTASGPLYTGTPDQP